jgi:predicted metal-dependent hydrolase
MSTTDKIFSIIVFVLIVFYVKNQYYAEVEIVYSKIDNRPYVVKSLPNKQRAADLLAKMNRRLILLVEHMQKNDGGKFDQTDVDRLATNFNPDNISEGTDKSNYTSYSINKGEKIIFCLRSRDGNDKLIDLNTVMYVAIHELGHLMTEEVGHPPAFWKNFRILLKEAVDMGLYKTVNYAEKPVRYCGIDIKSNVLSS